MPAIDVRIPVNSSAPRAGREALDGLEGRITAELLENARLLVSELITNSVRHAGLPETATIRLRTDLSVNRLRIEVADEGPGFDPKPAVPSVYRTSGWGLYLVDQISDRWGVIRGSGSRVWFELDGEASAQTG